MRRSLVRVLAMVFLAAEPSAAQLARPPLVNPARYESRSGDYVLEVDPSHRHGLGGATYRLTRRGQDVWSGERPFTLLGAAVTDEGVVAGFAYSGSRAPATAGASRFGMCTGSMSTTRADSRLLGPRANVEWFS